MTHNNMKKRNFEAKFYKEVYEKVLYEFTRVIDTKYGRASLKYTPLGLKEDFSFESKDDIIDQINKFDWAVLKHLGERVTPYTDWITAEYSSEICALVRDGAFAPNVKNWLIVILSDIATKPYKDFEDFDILDRFERYLEYVRREYCNK